MVSSNQVAKTAVHVLTQVKLNSLFDMDVLIDSGADESLMDWNLAKKLHIALTLVSPSSSSLRLRHRPDSWLYDTQGATLFHLRTRKESHERLHLRFQNFPAWD